MRKIIYFPFFRSFRPNRQPRVYGVAKQENAQIKCIVDANPPEVDFKWTFNNSAESIDVAASHVSRHGKHPNPSPCFVSEKYSIKCKMENFNSICLRLSRDVQSSGALNESGIFIIKIFPAVCSLLCRNVVVCFIHTNDWIRLWNITVLSYQQNWKTKTPLYISHHSCR